MTLPPESWPELYFDANATTPVLPAAIAAARKAMDSNFGNPSSTHSTGLRAGALLDAAHASARAVLGTDHGQIIFTSGATEGIQTAVLSALCTLRERRATDPQAPALLLYGATEHKAVPTTLSHWNMVLGLGCEIVAIPVGEDGRHDLAFIKAHAAKAALVCTMAVNNESGVISDLAGIRAALDAAASGVLWLVDSVQALGKITLALDPLRIDYAPFSGHKLYAPKGIGMLYVREGAPFVPLLMGGGQETGQRGGTENMPGIAALGAVLEALRHDDATFRTSEQLHGFNRQLADALRAAFPGLVMNAPAALAVSTTLNFSVHGLASREMMNLFDAAGMRVSSGSACNSSKTTRSFVLDAMGLAAWRSAAAVRLSFGPAVTAAEVDEACRRIARAGRALRDACLFGEGAQRTGHGPSGLLQMKFDGACSWIYADAASGRCVIVDPLPELADRIVQSIECRELQVAAIVATDQRADVARALSYLRAKLGSRMLPDCAPVTVRLADGSDSAAVEIGGGALARVTLADGACAYLLGDADGGQLLPKAVRHVFAGALFEPGLDNPALSRLAALISPRTLLLPAHDAATLIASTVQAERAALHSASSMPEVEALKHDIETFLQTHPEAAIVDVRESYEADAGDSWLDRLGRPAINIPLSQMAEHIPAWLANEEQALLFVCRTGNRSAQAGNCMRRLGHVKVWHMDGGIALAHEADALRAGT